MCIIALWESDTVIIIAVDTITILALRKPMVMGTIIFTRKV